MTFTTAESAARSLPRVLVIESDAHAALGLEDVLAAEGFAVLTPPPTLDNYLRLLEEAKPDVAVLDLDPEAVLASPMAEKLIEHGIPFVLVTGEGHVVRDGALAGVEAFAKPAPPIALARTLNRLLQEKTLRLMRAL